MSRYFNEQFRKTVEVNNTILSYRDIGKGFPIVLIHGMTLSSCSYYKTVDILLQNGFRVILIDLPGHGDSIIPPKNFSFSIENLSFTIISLIQKLNIKNFHIVGHSMGGIISLYIASVYSRYIKKVVVINTPVFGSPHRLLLSYPFIGEIMELFLGKWMIRKYLASMKLNEKENSVAINEYINKSEKKGFWLMLTRFSNEIFSNEFIKMVKNYKNFKNETLILWGEKDDWLPFTNAQKFDIILPSSKLSIIKNCGHNPHEECSKEFNKLLLNFHIQQIKGIF